MVSLRYIATQKENEERRDRILRARRQAAAFSVKGARQYRSGKEQQRQNVSVELHQEWQREQDAKAAALSAAIEEAEVQRGEGLSKAQEHLDARATEAQAEMDAWEAERVLEDERFKVARRRQQLIAEKEAADKAEVNTRRKQVLEQEANRSAHLVKKHRERSALEASVAAKPQETPRQQPSGPSAGDVAACYAEDRRRQIEEQQSKVTDMKKAAQGRATDVMQAMREEAEKKRLEKEQEQFVRKSMVENALKSCRHVLQSDFQEQEARRSKHEYRAVHHAFEDTFLGGVWPSSDIKRSHIPPVDIAIAEVDPLEPSDASILTAGLPGAHQLAVERLSVTRVLTTTDGDDESEPQPLIANIPHPTPRPSPEGGVRQKTSPQPATQTVSEGIQVDQSDVHVAVDAAANAMPEVAEQPVVRPASSEKPSFDFDSSHDIDVQGPTDHHEGQIATNAVNIQAIREQNSRFMSELTSLQQRLSAAAGSSYLDGSTSSDDDHLVGAGYAGVGAYDDDNSDSVTVSSMSETDVRLAHNNLSMDTSSESLNVTSTYQAKKLMMSAQQLRDALQRMKGTQATN